MLLLVAVTMYFLLGQLNKDIVFAQKERAGLQYNQALHEVSSSLQENRRVRYLAGSGDADAKGRLQTAQSKVDQAVSQLDTVDREATDQLHTQDAWAAIKTKWADLKSQSQSAGAQELYDRHTALLADVLALTASVGDTSNLILDPDLDSYYLMDATLTRLPALAEEITELRETGHGLASAQTVTSEETTRLIYKTASITAAFDAVKYGANVINQKNPALQPELAKPLQQLNDSFSAFKQGFQEAFIAPKSNAVPPSEMELKATLAVDDVHALYQTEAKVLDRLLAERRDHYAGIKYFVIGFVIVVNALVLYVFAAFYLSIMRAIRTLNEASHEVANGNLKTCIPVETRDEMGDAAQAFNAMVEAVKQIINSSKQTADQVTITSDKIVSIADQTSKANQQLALSMQETVRGANLQLSATEESSTAISEMSVGVQRIAASTESVSDLSQKASWSAAEGNQAIDKVIGQMATIQESVHQTAQHIQHLHAFAQQVHQIVEVIRMIAGQTNLLALNASIEAARVGEQGRGFMVVADETRKLAEQSARSAEEISDLIQQIQAASLHSVESMQGVIQDVQNGGLVVRESNESFRSILTSSQDIASQIQDISTASEEMAASSQQVAATIADISKVTRGAVHEFQSISEMSASQVAVMQELAEQAVFLNEMSQSLRTQIGRFTL
jgi:methyl-accepting chemotaxis protein